MKRKRLVLKQKVQDILIIGALYISMYFAAREMLIAMLGA